MGEPTGLDIWTAQVAAMLEVPSLPTTDREVLLNMTREVAHGVYRPAAPLTAYLLGVAVGHGASPQTAAAAVARLTQQWTPPHRQGSAERETPDGA